MEHSSTIASSILSCLSSLAILRSDNSSPQATTTTTTTTTTSSSQKPSTPSTPGLPTASTSLASIFSPIPSPISPMSPMPAIPPTPFWNQPTSQKFENLTQLRKKSFLPSKTCSYIFRKGAKKGEQCVRSCPSDEVLCSLHLKSKDNNAKTPQPSKRTAKYIPTRINRLRKFKKYFFVKVIEQTTVVLRCEGEKYILRLPYGMLNPKKPTNRHYIIRERNGIAVWKAL